MRDTALVFAGGDGPAAAALADLDPDAFVVAADSGLDHALALGVRVHLVVGDLDSVTESGLRTATAAGAVVEQHPPDKDATDLELAISAARDHGARRVTVFGGGGGFCAGPPRFCQGGSKAGFATFACAMAPVMMAVRPSK